MHRNIAPDVLYKSISEKQHSNPLFFAKMTHKERNSLTTLNNRTYDNIGFSTLYKLMRSFSILDVPTQGWGKQPMNGDVTISDDVERLQNVRRKIADRIKADIDLIEMNDYFSNIVNITQRIDTYLSKLPNQGFTREVLNSQTKCIDPDLEQKYYKALKVIEDMKGSKLFVFQVYLINSRFQSDITQWNYQSMIINFEMKKIFGGEAKQNPRDST
jgi:hypothetical protein